MAEEYNLHANWCNPERRQAEACTSSSEMINNLVSFSWPPEILDGKDRSPMELMMGNSESFDAPQKLHQAQDGGSDMNILGLSPQSIDWNQTLFQRDKPESSFRSMLPGNMNSGTTYETDFGASEVQSFHDKGVVALDEYKHIDQGFSINQSLFNPNGNTTDRKISCLEEFKLAFHGDTASIFDNSSTLLKDVYLHGDKSAVGTGETLFPPWPRTTSRSLRNSPPEQAAACGQLSISNSPVWSLSCDAVYSPRSTLLQALQAHVSPSNFPPGPKQDIFDAPILDGTAKKNSNETLIKRPRNEGITASPTLKVKKEKIGDRIAALQQLVSPFGKTDTASVLSEAIEYIKFLHEQVAVLSTPYLQSETPLKLQQGTEKSKDLECHKKDLRSKGLCLVPVSGSFPVNQETSVDYWTPTFGGTYR